MQKLDRGSVEILEVKIPDRKILGQLGYMAQEDALFKELTGKQNLEFLVRFKELKKCIDRKTWKSGTDSESYKSS